MKRYTNIVLGAALLALVGCGADAGTTAAQDAAFKSNAKPSGIVIPPDANKPPANFKDSMPTGGPGAPPPGTTGPGK